MAITFVSADTVITSATPVTLYTCPNNTIALVNTITAVNAGTGTSLIDGWLVRSGGGTTDDNLVHQQEGISVTEDIYLDKYINQTLNAGDSIQLALDAAGSVTIKASLREIT